LQVRVEGTATEKLHSGHAWAEVAVNHEDAGPHSVAEELERGLARADQRHDMSLFRQRSDQGIQSIGGILDEEDV
jgi:hypothetical protein